MNQIPHGSATREHRRQMAEHEAALDRRDHAERVTELPPVATPPPAQPPVRHLTFDEFQDEIDRDREEWEREMRAKLFP